MRRKSTTSEMMRYYIVNGLLAVMEKKNFHDIIVEDIVAKAGVSRSTYYRHFSKKEDVLFHFFDMSLKEFLEWSKTQELSFETYLCKLFEHYLKYKQELLLIYQSGQSLVFLEVLKKYFQPLPNKTKAVLEQYKVSFHIGGTFNQFLLWFSRDMQDKPEEMAKYTLAVLPDQFVPFLMGR